MDNDKRIQEIIEYLRGIDFIKPKDIPSINLYMDQLTTFMEEQLSNNRRNEEDKIMTKTMINNYTKNDLLPSPNKKRYSKEHLTLLIYIYYFKNILSITDIQTMLTPLIDNYYENPKKDASIADIYEKLYNFEHDTYSDIVNEVIAADEKASQLYDTKKDKYLHTLSVISILAADVYIKKKYMEKLIDELKRDQEKSASKKAKSDNASAHKQKAEKAKTNRTE